MINVHLARISNDLLVVAVLAYALAMLGYGFEFAFSGRPRKARPVAHAAASLDAIVAAPVARHRGDPGVAGSPRGEKFGRYAVGLTIFGWLAHLGCVVTRGLAAHRTPWGNMYEFSIMVTLAAVLVFLGSLVRHRLRYLGVFVMLPVVVTLGIAGTLLYSKAEPLQPALQSYWLKIHVTAAIIAWGVFMVGAVQTVLYLLQERRERRLVLAEATALTADAAAAVAPASTTPGLLGGDLLRLDSVTPEAPEVPEMGAREQASGGRLDGMLSRLPNAEALDAAAYKTIAFGFPIWTFAIICGSIWAEAAWGRYWGWDPKETWSFITWVIYAGYLHARATAGWKGRKASVIGLLAFGALTVDYYVINIVVSGLHSYAGL